MDKYYFAEKSNRGEKDYDYLWCGTDTDLHCHEDFYELFIVMGGTIKHEYNGTTQIIKKKQMFFFKPGETHKISKDTAASFHFSFIAKESFFERWFNDYPIFKGIFQGKKYVSCEMRDVEFDFIYKMLNTMTHQQDEEHKVTLFLFNALSFFMLNEEHKKKTGDVLSHVLDIVEKINNYTYLTCKASEIYKNYPIAQCTLIREFKNYTGKTITQYQREQKMVYAARMLIYQGCSVTDVSEQLHFESFSHFLHTFKQYYGVTPKEYRKSHIRSQLLNERDDG